MKKNYFYATINEEFSLLRIAVTASSKEEIFQAQRHCSQRHQSLCLRLFRDFITPLDRKDLYALSDGILEVFPTLFSLTNGEKSELEPSVSLLSSDPFRLDVSALHRREEFLSLWQPVPLSGQTLFPAYRALNRLSKTLLLTALNNA